MPTRRALGLFILAALFYFFANQTQVGWLYVVAALLAGLVVAARQLNRRALSHISVHRHIPAADGDVWEDDPVTVTLRVQADRPTYQIRLREQCPLADPHGDHADRDYFLPTLPAEIDYTISVYRRGRHEFPAVETSTRFPFGLFRRSTTIPHPSPVLVYPQQHTLDRLSLFNRQPAAQQPRPRSGLGTEVMGVRPYQTGDSARHIHWRTVARTGRLVTKEFADETQPALALIIDQQPPPTAAYADRYRISKENPFDTAVQIALGIGDYALRHRYPLHLLGPHAPHGAVTRHMLLPYLARLDPDAADHPLENTLAGLRHTFAAVLLPYPRRAHIGPLRTLHQRGVGLLVVVGDAATYPHHDNAAEINEAAAVTDRLQTAGIDVARIGYGTDWTRVIN